MGYKSERKLQFRALAPVSIERSSGNWGRAIYSLCYQDPKSLGGAGLLPSDSLSPCFYNSVVCDSQQHSPWGHMTEFRRSDIQGQGVWAGLVSAEASDFVFKTTVFSSQHMTFPVHTHSCLFVCLHFIFQFRLGLEHSSYPVLIQPFLQIVSTNTFAS